MRYLPIFIDVRDRPCLIVGGGDVGARKAGLLLRAGAQVIVCDPNLGESFRDLVEQKQARHLTETFRPEMLDGCALAFAATNDEAINRHVSEAAKARGIPVNVVDRPELCSFVMPSIVDRSPVVAAVSTGGSAPVLSR